MCAAVPGYVGLCESGELQRRAEQALKAMAECRMCPRSCGVNRLQGQLGFCQVGRRAQVSSCGPHLGEEDCLRGWKGSGTIFFTGCNLKCVFCQNYDISHEASGSELTARELATMMLQLQKIGCHNINWVTPSHVVPQILDSLLLAIPEGLRLPLVYNTGGLDAVDTLRLLDGVVDIYMPDFKYWRQDAAKEYLHCAGYPGIAQAAFREMHRQVGDLVMDERGLAVRGLLVRHLVMPGGLEDTREIMRFLAGLSHETYVNIMAQYRPAGEVGSREHRELNRSVSAGEMAEAYRLARETGLHRFDERQPVMILGDY